jgi:hypothetical protein
MFALFGRVGGNELVAGGAISKILEARGGRTKNRPKSQ